jgi:Xaa-Pro aminopeptidase
MPSLADLRARRERFLDGLRSPALLHAGGALPRNYPANTYPYRPDSNFLAFFAEPEPGSAALFDPQSRRVTLFLPARTRDDALWHGQQPDFDAMRERHGVDEVLDVERLEKHVRERTENRLVATVAVADPRATARLSAIHGEPLDLHDPETIGPPSLVRLLAEIRTCKQPDEIEAMRHTAAVTAEGHREAMAYTRPGVTEMELAGRVLGAFARAGCTEAYGSILSVRGEVLHNHGHGNVAQSGDVMLLDAGAEGPHGYCSDVTRCWPVSGHFNDDQRRIYDIVLRAQREAIALVEPGTRYKDVHDRSCEVIASGLVDLGLLRGDPAELVAQGAHALFYPHGVGHLIGLDVHDLEAFGDRVLYGEGRARSDLFGTVNLRIDLDLKPGMVVTIEPGIYFVPAILRDDELRARFAKLVDFDRACTWLDKNDGRGFGGIRIEDDVVCRAEGGPEVLTEAIPKEIADVEAVVGSAYASATA